MGVVLGRAARYSEAQQEFNAALNTCGEILKLRPRDAEKLYLTGMIRDDAAAFDACLNTRRCRSAQGVQLPTPLN